MVVSLCSTTVFDLFEIIVYLKKYKNLIKTKIELCVGHNQ